LEGRPAADRTIRLRPAPLGSRAGQQVNVPGTWALAACMGSLPRSIEACQVLRSGCNLWANLPGTRQLIGEKSK
jgi:hypothetical protein